MRRLAIIFILMTAISVTHAAKSSECAELLLGRAPVFAQLTGQGRENLRSDIVMGAVLAKSPLMLKAWQTNEYGFLVESMDFDYDTFILSQIGEGLDLNARDPNGRTALMHAASSGYSRLMWSLLKLGANIDLKDKDGRTAADLSMVLRNHASVRTDMFYVQNYLSYRGHYIASQVRENFDKRNFRQLEMLFGKGVYVDTFDLMVGKSLLTYAAEKNDLEMMRFLLKHGANPNFGNRHSDYNQYPVVSAAAACHKEAVDLLLEHGANLNARGSNNYDINPVRQAIWDYAFEANDKYPKLEMLEWWLKKGADPNANLEHLAEHQRESLEDFMNDLYWQPKSKPRRDHVEAILKTYGINTKSVEPKSKPPNG